MIRRQLGLLLLIVILGTYWTVCAVVVASNLAAGPAAPSSTPVTIAVAPNSTPVVAHIEETP